MSQLCFAQLLAFEDWQQSQRRAPVNDEDAFDHGAFGPGARHFSDVPALIAARKDLPAAASVLVKGSRFMQMERVVRSIEVSIGHLKSGGTGNAA